MSSAAPPLRPDAPARPLLRHEVLIGLAVFAVYVAVACLDRPARQARAVANSRRVSDLERTLRLDVEPALNRWLARHRRLRTAANHEYAVAYVVAAFGLLIWLYARGSTTYLSARRSFVLVNLVALACFALYPVAPPRLLADLGFVDTVLVDRTWGSWGWRMLSHANQLAAMPSLHFAWAVWVSLVLAWDAGHPVGQWLSGVHLLVSLLVIMATANHYLLDAVAGAALSVACVAVVGRPDHERTGLVDRVGTWLMRRHRAPCASAG